MSPDEDPEPRGRLLQELRQRRFPERAPVWGILLLVALTCMVLRRDEIVVGAAGDDAYYVEMARSLAAGRGPVLDVGPDVPPTTTGVFPPGFPLLLTPAVLMAPDSFAALKFVTLLAGLALATLCLALPDRRAMPWLGPALAVLVAMNPWVTGWSGRVLSDVPFAALSLGAVVAYRRWSPAPGLDRRGVLVVVLAAAAVLVRSVGVALVAALVADLLLRRAWRPAAALLVGVAVLVALPVVAGWGGGPLDAGYRAQLLGHTGGPGARLAFMAHNLWGYLLELPVALVPVFGKAPQALADRMSLGWAVSGLRLALGFLLAAGVGVGLWRGRSRLAALYLAFSFLALANFDGYPSGVQTRLLIPLLPFLYGPLLVALAGVSRALPRRAGVFVALVLAASLAHNAWRVARPLAGATDAAGRGFVDVAAGTDWMNAHAGAGDVVMAEAPLEKHIHFRRPVVGFGVLRADSLGARLVRHRVRWIFVGPHANHRPGELDEPGRRLRDLLAAEPGLAVPVLADPAARVWIYRVEPPGP